ncbi:MAG: hypothetical protein AAF354_11215, partial [Pseudomonadota bacterium]
MAQDIFDDCGSTLQKVNTAVATGLDLADEIAESERKSQASSATSSQEAEPQQVDDGRVPDHLLYRSTFEPISSPEPNQPEEVEENQDTADEGSSFGSSLIRNTGESAAEDVDMSLGDRREEFMATGGLLSLDLAFH